MYPGHLDLSQTEVRPILGYQVKNWLVETTVKE